MIATAEPQPPATRERILVVEDQPALRRAYARILEAAGYAVTEATDGQQALDALAGTSYAAVLTDITMPIMTGTELLHAIRARGIDVPVVLVTAMPTVASAIHAVEHGALRYLVKPVPTAALLDAMAQATRLTRIGRVKRESVAYLESLDRLADDRSAQESCFRAALGSLWMAYQPIVDWGRQQVVAYEALVRTREPSLVHPGALFDLAARLGALPEIGLAIRTSVARTLAECEPTVQVFVNLHPRDFLDEALYAPDAPLTAFASRVVLEVTEREALDETDGIAARASRLRQLGFRIAIDDLGAGYAGLNYFAQLTPDVVKIDMALVRNIHQETIKQRLVRSMASLCKELGMRVVAEGVETVEERIAVTEAGCDLMQGYLFARPGPAFPDVRW